MSLIYVFLAILGLSFLVFIHELGHYWIARRAGMKIEIFSIGFGRPIVSWMRQGVKWQICLLPFGGYVKIAGMQREGNIEPRDIADGFYSKSPAKRIQVALAGPLINIGFAFIGFLLLWGLGGRDKPFKEYTQRLGWVEPGSVLYEQGVRPGDVVQTYGGRPFRGIKDLLVASVIDESTLEIEGYKLDYETGERVQFQYTLDHTKPLHGEGDFRTIGISEPASYLIYGHSPLLDGSPVAASGMQSNDRLIWADGEMVFSLRQLSHVVNESTAFLTVRRGDSSFQTRVPRIFISDLKMSSYEKAEIDDWQHEVGIKAKLQDLAFIPYTISPTCQVESRLEFIDEQEKIKAFEDCQRCSYFHPLQEGDTILAINGHPVDTAYQLLNYLQTREVLLIVERNPAFLQKVLWTEADQHFYDFPMVDLEAIISSLGTDHPISSSGNLHLLRPVTPLSYRDLPFNPEQKAAIFAEIERQKKAIEEIKNPGSRAEALRQFDEQQNRLALGASLQDRTVIYNPNPFEQFSDVLQDTYTTLSRLFSGKLSPKFMAGPVGIVQVVHHSWMVGAKEAFYWISVISLSLGLLNLLPLPVLDGGHIVFALVEWVTKRPIKAKTMERMMIPFIGLLILFFVYITYQDLTRLFGKFF